MNYGIIYVDSNVDIRINKIKRDNGNICTNSFILKIPGAEITIRFSIHELEEIYKNLGKYLDK